MSKPNLRNLHDDLDVLRNEVERIQNRLLNEPRQMSPNDSDVARLYGIVHGLMRIVAATIPLSGLPRND